MHRRTLLAAGAAAALAAVLCAPATIASPKPAPPMFTAPSRADKPGITDSPTEPATIVDRNGVRYVAYQTGSQLSTTTDGGRTWKYFPNNLLTQKVTPCNS